MIRLGPVTRLLAVPALKRLGLILSIIVAIFVAESFTGLLERALRHDGGSLIVFWLLLMEAPEIVDLALAIGMLVAVFFAVTDSRNNGELIVLATNGVHWSRILGFALWFGVAGGIASILVAGYVVPKAKYSARIVKSQMRADHILRQINEDRPQNSIQTIQGTTFIATPPVKGKQDRGSLFVYQPAADGSWQIGQSQNWTVEGPNDRDMHAIVLRNLHAYSGAFFASNPRPINAFTVKQAGLDFHMSEVTSPPDRTFRQHERLLTRKTATSKKLSSLGSRALLVPTAALLALTAVLLGKNGLMRFLSLPLAAAVLLIYDVLGRTLVSDIAASVSPVLLILIAIVAYLGPPLAFVLWSRERIMVPWRGNP